ncbi:MAG: T9SS type A sorting domain-containing protein [Bacteroidetes bacterium]|nr:T9SS type A sorting domain-containing protein [Bacteroidota bacterium]
MKHGYRIVLLAAVLVYNKIAFCQYQTVSSGGTATGSGGSATYSIGLPLYTNQSNTSLIILQGNQQPREFVTVTYQKQTKSNLIKIYPNPAVSFIYIQLSDVNFSEISYKLTTADGRIILNEKITGDLSIVNIEKFSVGIYFLQLFKENELVSSTKIIKTNQ